MLTQEHTPGPKYKLNISSFLPQSLHYQEYSDHCLVTVNDGRWEGVIWEVVHSCVDLVG